MEGRSKNAPVRSRLFVEIEEKGRRAPAEPPVVTENETALLQSIARIGSGDNEPFILRPAPGKK